MPLPPAVNEDVIRRLSNGEDLPAEYLHVLFPPERREYELVYQGKKRAEDIVAGTLGVPLQPIRHFGQGVHSPRTWRNRLIFGDNLQAMKGLLADPDVKGRVKLVYIDPPFATKEEFRGNAGERAYQDKVAGAEFIEFIRERLVLIRELLAPDGSIYVHLDWRKAHYIKLVLDELFGENRFQSEIIWQRHDPHNDAVKRYGRIHDVIFWYSRSEAPPFNYAEITEGLSSNATKEYNLCMLDDSGEVVPWSPALLGKGRRFKLDDCTVKGRDAARQFDWRGAKKNPKRVWPAKSPAEMDALVKTKNLKDGDIYLRDGTKGAARCRVSFLDRREQEGQLAQDIWLNLGRMKGGSTYPTEKPEILLDRIIRASSSENDLVLDCFCGSGTTLAVAEKLRRRWIGVDCGKLAIYTSQKRLLNLREKVRQEGPALAAKPWTLFNAGLYDFQRMIKLPWKEYRRFAMQLFGVSDEPHRVSGIEVDGRRGTAECMIFNFQKPGYEKVRLDEAYVTSLAEQLGAKAGREFYIVAPASRVTFLQDYIDIRDTRFYILRIPYSIIDELHRRADTGRGYGRFRQLEQPGSAEDVNVTMNAVGFDFMQAPSVSCKYVRLRGSQLYPSVEVRITAFATEAMTREPPPESRDALSMVMIDYDYGNKDTLDGPDPFELDEVVYADGLRQNDWAFQLQEWRLGPKAMFIFVDVFGNELREVKTRKELGLPERETPVNPGATDEGSKAKTPAPTSMASPKKPRAKRGGT